MKVAAQTFRANPAFDTETAISELGTGEALVSFLDEKGRPNQVERAYILPPEGQIGPLDAETRNKMTQSSLLYRHYSQLQDRESAYEKLNERIQNTPNEKDLKEQAKAEAQAKKEQERIQKEQDRARREQEKLDQKKSTENKRFWG